MLRPSSMIGVRQYEQETLQGRWWEMSLFAGSYQPRSLWPCVKLMSVLWKIVAHWNGDCNDVS